MTTSWLERALDARGISQALPADRERIELPWSGLTVEVPRVHPVWTLIDGPTVTFAGIPHKRLVSLPPLIERVPAEPAVACLARAALGRDAWWAVWGSESYGVSTTTRGRTAYPPAVATAVARISGRARELMQACDRRSAASGSSWRREPGGTKGGLWDVVAVAQDGTLRFLECKRADAGGDRIRDNQRAFLEAALEVMDIEALAMVSWRATGAGHTASGPHVRLATVDPITLPATRSAASLEVSAPPARPPVSSKPWETNTHRKPPLRRLRPDGGVYETYDRRWMVAQVRTEAGLHWTATRQTPRLLLGRFPSRLAAFQALEEVDLREGIKHPPR